MDKKFNFLYVTTNLIDGKQYVGEHSTDCVENDQYLGSGILITHAIKKYGKKNFKREIIECFSTKQEAFDAQERYIKELNTLKPNGYNLSPTGGVGVNGCCSEETKQKMSAWAKTRTGELNGMYGKHLSQETKDKISKSNDGKYSGELHYMWGKKLPEETKQKISLSLTGKNSGTKHYLFGSHHSEETKQKISEGGKGLQSGEKHHQWGKPISDDVRKKISISLISNPLSEEKKKEKSKKASETLSHVKKITCDHCGKEFSPWNFGNHKKALAKKGIIAS